MSSPELKQVFVDLQEYADLTAVNQLIARSFDSEADYLKQIAEYLFEQKGKQVRPIITLLAARSAGLKTPDESVITIASGIELIHMATILHDDIIDHADLRRNRESANRKFGIDRTLLTGDFLLVRAFGLCGKLSKEIVQATEEACVALTEGEILELPLSEHPADLEYCEMIASKKTAALFKLACFSGAHVAGLPADLCQLYAIFGENIGVAFQMLDDILDVTSEEDRFGKKVGTDLREKKPSLINVLYVASEYQEAKELLSEQQIDISKHLEIILSSNIPSQATQIAGSYAQASLDILLEIKERLTVLNIDYCAESFEYLEKLVKFIMIRQS